MTDPDRQPNDAPLRVVIAGAGVAGLEAAFALRELAGDRVRVTLVAPTEEFVYRPMAVGEPFSSGWAERYPLDRLVGEAGAEHVRAAVVAVDPQRREVRTDGGAVVAYDALLIALGATSRARYEHATLVDDAHIDDLLHGLVQDIEGGYVRRLGVVVPAPAPWPLPAYELALLSSERAWNSQTDLDVTVFTPEPRPLAAFGIQASLDLSRLLAERRVEVVTSAYCEVPHAKLVVVHPGDRSFDVDRVIALPELHGPELAGLPWDGGGFIPIDEFARVREVEGVWAAGDAADFNIKHGGVAAQLADTAAQDIAALTGACPPPAAFEPVLEGVLLTGGRPRYLRAHPTGGHGEDAGLSPVSRNQAPPKIAARYLGPHLEALRHQAVSTSA